MKRFILFSRILLFLLLWTVQGELMAQNVRNITILQPNRTMTLDWSCQLILWTLDAPNVQFLRVDISTDFGQTWYTADFHEEPGVPEEWAYNDGYLTFCPPHVWTKWAHIRLSHVYKPGDFVKSEPFEITSPTPEVLRLVRPQAGDTYTAGTAMEIAWESNYYMHYKLDVEYSLNRGKNWITIEEDTENDGYFVWRIPPELESENCEIRIIHQENGITFESSAWPVTINQSTWGSYFMNVTSNAGINVTGMQRSASWVDLNQDGWLDLFFTGTEGYPNVLYMNNGDKTFSKASLQPEVERRGMFNLACVFGDINNDGLPDLYLGEGSDYDDKLFLYSENGAFVDITEQAGIASHWAATNGVAFLDYDRDGDLDIYVCKGGMKNLLYRNNGNVTFTDVTAQAGVGGTSDAWSSTVAVGDYDRDLYPDLYVANSSSDGNVLYHNNGDGTFTDVTDAMMALQGFTCVTAEWGDYNTDGLMDLYVTRRNYPNALFQYNYDRTFSEVTQQAQVGDNGDGTVVGTGDFDCDGRLDICLGNRGMGGSEKTILYLRNRDAAFDEIGAISGLTPMNEPRGMAVGDYDNDGDLDLYITDYGGVSKLFENKLVDESYNNWLKIRLVGVKSSRDAVGTRVMLYSENVWQMREVGIGTGFGSQNSLELEFGVGRHERAESMAIYWPSGRRHTFSYLPVDSVYLFQEIPDSLLDILEGTLTISSPTAESVFYSEETVDILWETTGNFDNVLLEFSPDGGMDWHVVGTTANDGGYDWTVPRSVHSDSCLMRLSDAEDGLPSNTTDMFTVEIPTVPLSWNVSDTVGAGVPFNVDLMLGNGSHGVYSMSSMRADLVLSYFEFLEVVPGSIELGPIWGETPTTDVQIDTPQSRIVLELGRSTLEGGFDGTGRVLRFQVIAGQDIPDGADIVMNLHEVTLVDTAGVTIPTAPESLSVNVTNTGVAVWPGDMNNDGIVNQEDILPLGFHWELEGRSRTGGSSDWTRQNCIPWDVPLATYSDGNGDGTIDLDDLISIQQNWGMEHQDGTSVFPVGQSPSNVVIGIQVTGDPSSEVFYVNLSVTGGLALFGAALSVYYDTEKVEFDSTDPGTIWGDDVLFVDHNDPVMGKTDIGISQKKGQDASMNEGVLATLYMRIKDGVPLNTPVIFWLDDVEAINPFGGGLLVTAENGGFVTGIEDDAAGGPDVFRLYPNYPNPFNPSTVISYQLPADEHVVLRVYDTRGQEVRTLVNERQERGAYSVDWDGSDNRGVRVSSGVYVYRIVAGDNASTRKCILMK